MFQNLPYNENLGTFAMNMKNVPSSDILPGSDIELEQSSVSDKKTHESAGTIAEIM